MFASDHLGQNVVLKPNVVDKKLKLKNVSTHTIHKYKKQSFVNNHMYVEDFGENNSSFKWVSFAPEDVQSLESIKRDHLGVIE